MLEVVENGPGLPSGFDVHQDAGTGLQVVAFIAGRQLRGALELLREDEHTIARIRFPMGQAPRADAHQSPC